MPLDALKPTLKSVFGFDDLREQQKPIVSTVMQDRDMLAILKTSGGKSLCYQLPAVHRKGLTLVISPLISLMKDQVDTLEQIGVAASYANSSIETPELHRRYRKLSQGEYALFYISPERFEDKGFVQALLRSPLSVIAIDEAHCASQWGHDFRPAYSRLGKNLDRLEEALSRPLQRIAFTATANSRVQKDVCEMLGLRDPVLHIQDFDRSNLTYSVIQCGKNERIHDLMEVLQEHKGDCTIIYCVTVKEVERLTSSLREYGVAVERYHGRLESEEKTRVQDEFIRGDIPVLISTSAFGMGVDKSDVRLVIHAQMPGSLEAWYQEAGRAGRDGKPAKAILLYNDIDKSIHKYFISVSSPASEKIHPIKEMIYRQLRHGPAMLDPKRIAINCAGQIAVINRFMPENAVETANIDTNDVKATINLLANQGEIEALDGIYAISNWSDETDYGWVDEVKQNNWMKFNSMCSWAETNLCRRWQILRYFDERKPHYHCGNCDNCQREALAKLANDHAQKVVRPSTLMTLANALDAIGIDDKKRWIHVLLGSISASEMRSEEKEFAGRFAWHAVGDISRWASMLIDNKVVDKQGSLTSEGKNWIAGVSSIPSFEMTKPVVKKPDLSDDVIKQRLRVLRAWRKATAYRDDVSEMTIATEGVLNKIAKLHTIEESSLIESGSSKKWVDNHSHSLIKAIDKLEKEFDCEP